MVSFAFSPRSNWSARAARRSRIPGDEITAAFAPTDAASALADLKEQVQATLTPTADVHYYDTHYTVDELATLLHNTHEV